MDLIYPYRCSRFTITIPGKRDKMLEVFAYNFMINAITAGVLSALIASVLGNFLVASRQAMTSDMLAHSSLGGVGLGIFLNLSPHLFAFLFALASGSLLFLFSRKDKSFPEAFSMMMLTGGVAFAVLFSHMAKNAVISLEVFLFGSVLTTTTLELVILGTVAAGIGAVIFLFWKRYIGLSFDKAFTKTQFKHALLLEYLFFVMIAVVVSCCIKVIGALLIGALLVIPTLTAQLFARSFCTSVLISAGISVLGSAAGIISSFYFDIPSSSAIVLGLIGLFMIAYVVKKACH